MKQERVKAWWLLEIDKILKSGKKVTAVSIAEEIGGVSFRTIQRDIEYLRDMYNAPIEYDASCKTYYYSEPNFYIESVPLSEGELFSIALFDQLLEQYRNTPLEGDLRNIFRKIVACLPENTTVDSGFLEENVTFISEADCGVIDNVVFEGIFKCLNSKTTLQFDYLSLQKTSFMTRFLAPYHVGCQRGNWYVIGYCHDKNEIRVFNFGRMKNVVSTGEKFVILSDFNPDNFFDKDVGVLINANKKYDVELLISKYIGTFAIDRRWHSNQIVRQNEDGSVYVKFTTN